MEDTKEHEWKIQTFLKENEIPPMIDTAQNEGWFMHSIDLQEGKIIFKRLKKERLDG